MKRASAILKALFIGLFFVCIALALHATGRDEAFVLSEKAVYLFLSVLNALVFCIVWVVEYMTRPTKH